MTVTAEQLYGAALGLMVGLLVSWLLWPWVDQWRRKRQRRRADQRETDAKVSTVADPARLMRVGRALGRTLYLVDPNSDDYRSDQVVGIVDTVWLAKEIAHRWNFQSPQWHEGVTATNRGKREEPPEEGQ